MVQSNDCIESNDRVLDAIVKVSQQLETFNLHYLTKLEDKFLNIMSNLNNLNANVKQLQEKTQVLDIFRHHVNSWNEHIKSTDRKIEILKSSFDSLPLIENQLRNTDFKVQHVFEKTDQMNEKLNEISKSMLSISGKNLRKPKQKDGIAPEGPKSWSQEDFEQTEILMRLSKIQRMLQNSCSAMRLSKEVESLRRNSKFSAETSDDELLLLKSLMVKINGNLERFPIREIKQSFSLNKKQEKSLEVIISTVNNIDERTVRIFDTNSYYFKKIMSASKSTEHEVLTFTSNADTLLKRVEKVIKNVNDKSTVVPNEKCEKTANITEIKEQLNELDIGSASGEFEEDILDERGEKLIFI